MLYFVSFRMSFVKCSRLHVRFFSVIVSYMISLPDDYVPKSVHEHAISLTLALYRVTNLLPVDESLRYTLRERANAILENIVEYGYLGTQELRGDAASSIRILESYLELVDRLALVNRANTAVLKREYGALADFFENKHEPPESGKSARQNNPAFLPKQTKNARLEQGNGCTQRQEKILFYLGQNTQAGLSDFSGLFKDVSSKTIQRDLADLISKKRIAKQGAKKWTVYSLA